MKINFHLRSPESEMRIIPVVFRPILLSLPTIQVRLKSNTIIKLGNYWTWKYIKIHLSLLVSPIYREPEISWLYLPSKYLNRKIRIKTAELMAVFSLFSRFKFNNKFSQVLTRIQLNLSIIWSYHPIEDGFQSEVENVRLTAINYNVIDRL